MKKTRWVNFVWDLAGNELPAIAAPRQYRLSLVKAGEREQLQGVIEKSFALDPGWNPALHMIDAQVKSSIAAACDSGVDQYTTDADHEGALALVVVAQVARGSRQCRPQ